MATAVRTADEQTEAQAVVQTARKELESYFQATTKLREQTFEDFKFVLGGENQWLEKDLLKLREEDRPVLTFNLTQPIINFLAGYQLERDQDYRIHPRGSEDEQLGRILTAQIKYAMDQGVGGSHIHHQLFRKGIIGGMSIIEIGHSFDLCDDILEGEIVQDVLAENSWACEPGARRYDRQDASWQTKLMWMRPEEAVRLWPQHVGALKVGANRDWMIGDPSLTGVPDHLLKELFDEDTGRIRILQRWYRVPVTVSLVINTQTGEVQRMESPEQAEQFIRSVYDTAGKQAASAYQIEQADSQSALINRETAQIHTFNTPDKAMKALDLVRQQAGKQAADTFELVTRQTTALRVCHLTGWELLDDKPSPNGADWRYPFVPYIVYQDTDDYNSIKGAVRDIKDPQREVNWHYATMLDSLVRGPKSGVWLPRTENSDISKLKREFARAGFMGEYQGQPPVPVTPGVLSPDEIRMLEMGVEMIMRISGVNAEMVGQTTQKTVSGRAIGARQAGGLVGVGSLFHNWLTTKRLIGDLLVRGVQRHYSVEKMDRILGQNQRIIQAGPLGSMVIPDVMMFEYFKRAKMVAVDTVVGFQPADPTARHAVVQQMLEFRAAGMPVPLEFVLEASDIPFKQEIQAALAMMGEQPADPASAKAVSAGQGQGPAQPNGVNTTA